MAGFHLVSFVILHRDDRILLARRQEVSYGNGHWCLPGGHVEPGESLAQTAARETREEVGVEVDAASLRPIGMCRYTDAGTAGLDVFFDAAEFTGEPAPLSECDLVGWHRLDDLPEPVVPWLPEALQHHLVERRWFREALG